MMNEDEVEATISGVLAADSHNTKEERIASPRTDAALDASERADLVARLQVG